MYPCALLSVLLMMLGVCWFLSLQAVVLWLFTHDELQWKLRALYTT